MYNWSVDLKKLQKDRSAFSIWKLEQLINFGLGKELLAKSQVSRNWNKLHLDPAKKRYLKFLLK